MATVLTSYFLQMISPGKFQCEILDPTDYPDGYQIYVDNRLVDEEMHSPLTFRSNKNQKIDVVGLDSGESGFNFHSILDDTNGDKVELSLPSNYVGTVSIYSDAGTGIINWGKRLGRVNVVACSGIGWGDEPEGDFPWGEDSLGWGYQNWGHSPYGHGMISLCAVFVTKRQGNGTVKFAIVPVSNSSHGTPVILTETITTRPDESIYHISHYDSDTDTITIEVQE